MATLIQVYNSIGGVGRCNEKCYNATMPRCCCICGGVNHGVGLEKARANTKEITDEQLRKNTESSGRGRALDIFKEQIQSTLF